MDCIRDFVNGLDYKKYIIYGTGEAAKECYDEIVSRFGSDAVEGFTVTNYKVGNFMDKPIFNIKHISENKPDVYYILASLTNFTSMRKILLENGVSNERILEISSQYSYKELLNKSENVSKIAFWPQANKNEINELLKLVNWYLNPAKFDCIDFYSFEKEVPIVEGISFINSGKLKKKYDVVFVFKENYLNSPELKDTETYCIQPNEKLKYLRHEMFSSLVVRAQNVFGEFTSLNDLSVHNYNNLKISMQNKSSALLIGMGPSMVPWIKENFFCCQKQLVITCNKYYATEVSSELIPDVYCISDFRIFMEKEQISGIMSYVKRHNCLLVTEDVNAFWIIHKYNYSNVIGLKDVIQEDMRFITPENLTWHSKGTVVIDIMCPLVAGFCKEINIIGCDGSPDKNALSWTYAAGADQTKMHSNNVIPNYYDVSEKNWEKMLSYAEDNGVACYCRTKSYFEALKKRYKES